MKVVAIRSCSECPHLGNSYSITEKQFCRKTKSRIGTYEEGGIDINHEFLPDCPLKDAKEGEE